MFYGTLSLEMVMGRTLRNSMLEYIRWLQTFVGLGYHNKIP